MIDLLVFDDNYVDGSLETSFGGRPVVNANEKFSWPSCAQCRQYMQYEGKVSFKGELYLLFMCEFEAGSCEGFETYTGANQVIRFIPEDAHAVDPPPLGQTTRPTSYGSRVEQVEAESYGDAATAWPRLNGVNNRQVLGSLGGEPAWYQGDQTPNCTKCGTPMSLVAHLEEGPDYNTGMNFGGGVGFIFTCLPCPGSAQFLFQC